MSQVLLKTRKNEVFQVLVDAELDPAAFQWVEVPSMHEEVLTSRLILQENPGFYFHFDYLRGQDWAEMCPGEKRRVEQVYHGAWEGQKEICSRWARRLKHELEARDLWEEIERYRGSFSLGLGDSLTDEPISADEADEIAAAIEELKTRLTEAYQLQEGQLKFITERLDLLSDAARRQGCAFRPSGRGSPEEVGGSFRSKWHGSERSDAGGEFRLLPARLTTPRPASSYASRVLSG